MSAKKEREEETEGGIRRMREGCEPSTAMSWVAARKVRRKKNAVNAAMGRGEEASQRSILPPRKSMRRPERIWVGTIQLFLLPKPRRMRMRRCKVEEPDSSLSFSFECLLVLLLLLLLRFSLIPLSSLLSFSDSASSFYPLIRTHEGDEGDGRGGGGNRTGRVHGVDDGRPEELEGVGVGAHGEEPNCGVGDIVGLHY